MEPHPTSLAESIQATATRASDVTPMSLELRNRRRPKQTLADTEFSLTWTVDDPDGRREPLSDAQHCACNRRVSGSSPDAGPRSKPALACTFFEHR
jgi:hypothetical protein